MRRRPGGATGWPPSKGRPEAWASRWARVEPGGPTASSRSTVPSSQATRQDRETSSLVTEAHAKDRSVCPAAASTPFADTTPAAPAPGQAATAPARARASSSGTEAALPIFGRPGFG